MAASVIIKKVELFIIFCGLPAGWWLHVVLSLKTASCSIFFSFITEDFCVCNIVGTTTDRLPKGLFLPVFFVPSIDIIHKNEPSRQIMTISLMQSPCGSLERAGREAESHAMAIVLWNSIYRWLVAGDHRRPTPYSREDYDVVLIDVVRASEPRLPIRRCNGQANPKLPRTCW